MKWRWMEGMKDTNGTIVTYVCEDGEGTYVEGYNGQMVVVDEDCEPDWGYPATLGCLVAQVRDAFPGGQVSTFPVRVDGKDLFACWHWDKGKHLTSYAETEAAALLAALEGKGV